MAGAHLSEKAVARFLGLNGFDRFVTLRIDAAKDVVDAIGGIDVVPDETMNYDDNWGHLHIHFVGGKLYHMNGEQAVSYSRFRHDACSDPCRIKRQQQVMRIVLKKLENDKLNDLMHVNALIGVIRRNVITDVSDREALSIAMAMKGVDLKAVKMNQVPFTADKILTCCGDVLVADDDAKAKLVRQLFIDPVVPPIAPTAAALAAVSPASITLDVKNGSGVSGGTDNHLMLVDLRSFDPRHFADDPLLSQRIQAALANPQNMGEMAGADSIGTVGNADGSAYSVTQVHVRPSDTLSGNKVLASLPFKGAQLTPDVPGAAKAAVTVIVGHDFADSPQREASAVR